jgi:hypothetical protein
VVELVCTAVIFGACFGGNHGGTYCLGVHFTISADLDVPSSEAVGSAFE